MSSSSEFVVIRDPHHATHAYHVSAADGYWQCASCALQPGNARHRLTRNGKIYVVVYDAAISSIPMAVELSLVTACITGDQLAAAVRAQASPLAVAA
jgi:hypothetical protein